MQFALNRFKLMYCCDTIREVTLEVGDVEIDLFASRLNKKCEAYVSWKPDPGAKYIDAFSLSWKDLDFYAFPPFSMILRSVGKIRREKACGILIVPLWPTQAWFPQVMRMLIESPLLLPLN